MRSTLFAVLLAVGALALTVEADDTVSKPLTDKQKKRNRRRCPVGNSRLLTSGGSTMTSCTSPAMKNAKLSGC
jgi:hypothetical protein